MLRPAGPRRQSKPQLSEFEAALRHNEPLLRAATVTIPSEAERQAVAIAGTPEVPAFDPGRTVTWKVDGSAVQFDLAALLAKPAVTVTTPLNATNAVVHSMGNTLCMLARSTDSPSQAGRDADENALHEGIPLAKMRLPKTLWPSANPPAVLWAQVRGDGWADFDLNRAPAHDTTTAYGWEAAATGEACTTQPGDQFVMAAYTDAAYSVPFPLSKTNIWKYLNPAVPQRSADQVEELARDAAGKALAGGGGEADSDVAFAVDDASNKIKGTLKDGAVDPAKLEAGTVAQKIALRRAIGAEGELQAGVGVVIGAPDRNGVRQIGVQNPTAVAGGALGAEDAYRQTRLDRLHDWKMEAIQYTEPHVINLTWAPGETPTAYEGSTRSWRPSTATPARRPFRP